MISMPGSDLDFSTLAVPKSSREEKRTELGQEDFLALMISQLQNQDPFAPMENGEFLGQMAQFSTVSGIGEMTESLANLSNSLYAGQALQAATMIGKSVLSEGYAGMLGEEEPFRGAVDMPYSSNTGYVRITSPNGQLVRELQLGPRAAGLANFEWDGLAANGTQAPPGEYWITAGFDDNGQQSALSTFVTSRVSSVSLSASGAGTSITTENGQQLSISQIRAVL